jgi:hypothetical protein
LHDRVLRRMEMLGRVLVLRTIAAAHMATVQTHAQVNPSVPSLQALFTASRVRHDVKDRIEVRTFLRHGGAPFHWLQSQVRTCCYADRARAPHRSRLGGLTPSGGCPFHEVSLCLFRRGTTPAFESHRSSSQAHSWWRHRRRRRKDHADSSWRV